MTAAAYATGWLPGVFGGPLLSAYADRLPRRQVIICCDVVRALLVAILAVVAVPGVPLPLVIALLFVANLFSAPFSGARSALMPEVLAGDAYVTGNGLGNITFQLGQLAAFATGGLVIAVLTARGALLLDAVTFALSAILVAIGVRRRSAALVDRRGVATEIAEGLRYIADDPWLRGCLAVVWAGAAFTFASEALAYPLARSLGGGPPAAGLLLAAPAAGFAVGALLLTRVVRPVTRSRLMLPAAMVSTMSLVPALLTPPLAVMVLLLAAAGAGASFAAPLNAIFMRRVDTAFRGRAMGVAISGLTAVQGLAFLVAGGVAESGLSPAHVAGGSGLLGTGVLGGLWAIWARAGAVRPDAEVATG
jgi:predicted MFS family arabinose efflux permease